MVPVLGDDATLTVADGELRYYEHRFPLAPGQLVRGRRTRRRPRAAALRAGAPLARQRRTQLPPLLRGDHARRGPGQEDPTCSRRPTSGSPGWWPTVSPGCGSTTPTVWSIRRSTWTRLRDVAPDAVDHGGEDPGAGRAAAGLAGGRHHRLRRDARGRTGSSSIPTAEPVFTELYIRLTGDQLTDRRARRAGQADGGDRRCCRPRSAGSPPWLPTCPTPPRRSRSWRWLSRCTAPTCRPGSTDLDGPCNTPSAAAPSWLDALAYARAPAARRGRRTGPPDAAAERRHDGQGGRGHRLLPVRPLHRPERGRRRSGSASAFR